MLGGYYVLFINMPQLSVEVLLPAGLLTAEHLLRKPGYKTLVWFAVVFLLVFVGGMPESSVLLLAFVYLYLFFRIASDAHLRSNWKRPAAHLVLGTVAGVGLSAFLLLPFREFMKLSFDSHQAANISGVIMGVQHEIFSVSIFTYLFPLLFGPIYPNLRNYVGLVGVFLILIAIAGLFRREERRNGLLVPLTGFCVVYVLGTVLKRYGFKPVNIIGYLPLFNLIWFAKYGELALSIAVSILYAIGLERFARSQVSTRAQVTALLAAFLLIPLALATSWRTLLKAVSVEHVRVTIPLTAIAVPACALFCVALVLILVNSAKLNTAIGSVMNRRFSIALLSILSFELFLNFIAPVYYFFNKLPTQAHNPYAGAPYLRLLQKEARNTDRVMGRDGVLFPNWASAFQLFDIRDLDALYYKKFFPFLQNFLSNLTPQPEDLRDRFNGTGDYDLRAPLPQRLLQISSVRYIAAIRAFFVPNTIIEDILKQNQQLLATSAGASVGRRDLVIAGDAREGLGEHPPYTRLPYELDAGNAGKLRFSYGLDPAVFDKTAGDGVGFTVEVKAPSGVISKAFSHYIDPKHNPDERRWVDGEIDLSKYRGQTIELLLSTDPGPKGDTSYDWAVWSNFHFDNESNQAPQPFELIYNGEVRLYRYDNVLPRAAIYYEADVRANGEEVLHRLTDPALDVFQTVALDASTLDSDQRAALEAVNHGPRRREQPARITSYRSQSVSIEAALDQPGILVLNDSDYPGWTVDIDGHAGKWFTANYLFRGVLLPPGKHTVRFVYRPKSFTYGATISAATLLSLLGFGLYRRLTLQRRHSRSFQDNQSPKLAVPAFDRGR